MSSIGPLLALAAATTTAGVHPFSNDIELRRADVVSGSVPSGRRLRGDWEPPDAVVLVYNEAWPDAWTALIEELSRRLPVALLTEEGYSAATVRRALKPLSRRARARIWVPGFEVDSAWARDYGPLQVRTPDRGVIWLDAPYTESRPKDDVIPAKLAARLPARTESLGWAIDGGAIASNGEGLCVMTHEYAQGIDLAFGDDPTTIEVLDIVGCPHFVLVPALSQEETKHVDLFLQFIEPDVVVVGEFDRDEAPEDALRMDIAIDGLIRGANRGGLDLVIVRVPTPAPEGNIYRSYVNFFRTADLLLVPRYLEVPDLLERAAYDVLDEVMPGLDLVPIPSDDIVEYGGALHCTTLGLAISTAEWPTTALNEK